MFWSPNVPFLCGEFFIFGFEQQEGDEGGHVTRGIKHVRGRRVTCVVVVLKYFKMDISYYNVLAGHVLPELYVSR